MKAIGITVFGMEDIAIQEMKDFGFRAEKISGGRIEIEVKKVEEIYAIAYRTRGLHLIYQFLDKVNFSSLDELKICAENIDISIVGKFKVQCHRTGKHEFNSMEVEKIIGEAFYEKGHKVDLKNPETIVFADIIEGMCFFGIAVTDFTLSKRDYRIKSVQEGINAALAYCVVRENWNKKEILLDPFCKDGVVIIEAASYALNLPSGYFRKRDFKLFKTFDFSKIDAKIENKKLNVFGCDPLLHNVRDCEIHSKLANVNKNMEFSRVDTEWLDTKYKEKSVDKVITVPPYMIKKIGERGLSKIYDEFFFQLEFILKDDGKIIFIAHGKSLLEEAAKKYKFTIKNEKEAAIGETIYKILTFEKC
ncbi:hypothetical protein J4468_02605 [Candidatus Woesearchaeota archaeon]|nr:hypothetical protein [Candidatus Woesearchaeota archaeon]